nr:hypothetical protein [Proteus mirabilis]APO16933.1 hypothetical protein [Proteus mirabilis]
MEESSELFAPFGPHIAKRGTHKPSANQNRLCPTDDSDPLALKVCQHPFRRLGLAPLGVPFEMPALKAPEKLIYKDWILEHVSV